jgi:hypothetical protein
MMSRLGGPRAVLHALEKEKFLAPAGNQPAVLATAPTTLARLLLLQDAYETSKFCFAILLRFITKEKLYQDFLILGSKITKSRHFPLRKF